MKYLEEIDVPSAKERFMENEALYKKFLYQFPDKCMIDELEKYVEDKDAEEAFKSAHTMKGVVGNLSLYKLMDTVSGIVEILRARNLPSEDEMAILRAAYNNAIDAVNEVKDGDISLFS